MMTWALSQASIIVPKPHPCGEDQPSHQVHLCFHCPRPPAAYLLPFLATEPSPSKSIQVTRCRIILSLWDTLLWSDLSSSLGSLCPALRKQRLQQNIKPSMNQWRTCFRLWLGFFSLSSFPTMDTTMVRKMLLGRSCCCKSEWWIPVSATAFPQTPKRHFYFYTTV